MRFQTGGRQEKFLSDIFHVDSKFSSVYCPDCGSHSYPAPLGHSRCGAALLKTVTVSSILGYLCGFPSRCRFQENMDKEGPDQSRGYRMFGVHQRRWA